MNTSPFSVTSDPLRNLLQVTIRGVVTGERAAQHIADVASAISGLRRGFTALVDFTGVERMELESVALLTGMMDACVKGGVARVVRVVPDPAKDIGLNILSITHYRGKVPIATCETRAAAETELGRV